MLTNTGIWALYGRSPGARARLGPYRAFVQARRLASRVSVNSVHNVAIEYDKMRNALTYFVEGEPLWHVPAPLGVPTEAHHGEVRMILDHPGREQPIRPDGFQVGVGKESQRGLYSSQNDTLWFSNDTLV